MTESPDITVVLCTYNRAKVLRLALDSLVSQDTGGEFTYDIVVVNDRSTDETAEVIEEIAAASRIRITMVMAAGEGVAAARNLGKDNASGEWIAYTDDDQVNEPDWLIALYRYARENDARVVGGCVYLRFDEEPSLDLTWVTKSILGFKETEDGIVKWLMASPGTGNVMFHRSIFEEIGGFDNSLRWGAEDADIMMRVRDAGIPVWFTRKSVVHHLIPPYRTQPSYFRWASLRVGVALAELDRRLRGRRGLAIRCLGRVAKALCVQTPMLVVSKLTGNHGDALERQCVLWRCYTYSRATLFYLAPSLFPQQAFFDSLTFRAERTSLGKSDAS